jgi:O-antigen ligase
VQSLILLAAGLLALAVLFLHPIGPAVTLIALFPFDAIFYALFGQLGNSLTVIFLVIFLVRTSPQLWPRVWIGTRIQLAIVVLALSLFVAHAWAVPTLGKYMIFEYVRKLVRFGMVGVFVWSMREPRFFALCLKVLVITMSVYTVLAAGDYYLGIQILPTSASEWGGAGALAQGVGEETAWKFRFSPPGIGDPNCFANTLLLPIFCSLAWFLSNDKAAYRAIALGCCLILVVAILLTVSRSGIAAAAIGGVVLLPTVFRVNPVQVILIVVVGVLLPVIGWLVLMQLGLDDALFTRFGSGSIEASGGGRIALMRLALELFAHNPIIGLGEGIFSLHSPRGKIVHNAYLGALVETGLLGFIPLATVLWLAFRQLLRKHSHIPPEVEYWRPFLLAAMLAGLLQNNLNDFLYDRPMWFLVAIAAALERYDANAMMQHRSQQAEPVEPGFDPLPPLEPRSPPGGSY